MSKPLNEMADSEILTAAGDYGPAIIGQELFDRAQAVRKHNPTGALGPAILGTPEEPKKSSKKKAAE